MRQRVAIARAFVSEPALLLMDEPFSALDELTSEVLRRELLQLWHSTRTTVVFVSHSVSEAVLLSDQVVVMTPAPGRIATVIDVTLERPRRPRRGDRRVPGLRARGPASPPRRIGPRPAGPVTSPRSATSSARRRRAARVASRALPGAVLLALLALTWQLVAVHNAYLIPTVGRSGRSSSTTPASSSAPPA